MKVPASVRRIYEDQLTFHSRLKTLVDERVAGLKQPRWHYESRIKELDSFALKLESGRFDPPTELEDFFACTLVVANATEIATAEEKIASTFPVRVRRPASDARTRKSSECFPFDDLRLYVTVPDRPSAPPTDLTGRQFEIQIKTFLQHAWSIATHDLTYKCDDADWSKERIAFQIRAMLEHAEVSIQQAGPLAQSGLIAKEDTRTASAKATVRLIQSQWSTDELPRDVRRLATNINGILEGLRLEWWQLETILERGKAVRSGTHPTNLSPYATVVQYLCDFESAKMLAFLKKPPGRRVFIPEEVELPAGTDRDELTNAVLCGH